MLTYKFSARNAEGKEVKSEVQANTEAEAIKNIKAEGLTPIELKVMANHDGIPGLSYFKTHIKAKDKVLFSRQLSTLINAGLPLLQSLRSVGTQSTSKPLKAVVLSVINDVEAGSALSVAMSHHPKAFNQVYVSMIAAGETSGTLDKSLERLAIQQEKDAELISKVRGAMVYPVIVLVVMFGVVGFMLVSVLPQVQNLYDGLSGVKLPFITIALLALSHALIHYWWVALIVIVFLSFVTGRWARTLGGKRVIDKLKMKLWPFGPLFMKMYMARFARTGSTLVASGVPLLQMLDITANAVNNIHITESIHKAMEQVRGGKALSDTIQNDKNFLELVPNMLRIGEQSGAMEQMLGKVADYFEKEVDDQVKTISTIIEPLLMVLLGIMAFTIVAAILLPIYSLAGKDIV
jgi:type IV pilus assembly protein PilC